MPLKNPCSCQENEAVHGDGGFIGIELDDEFAAFGHFNRGEILFLDIDLHRRRGRKLHRLLRSVHFGW